MYIVAVNKSQEFFLLNIRRLFNFFDDYAAVFTSTRHIFISTTTHGIRLRRRVDVFSTTSYCTLETHETVAEPEYYFCWENYHLIFSKVSARCIPT